MGLPTEYSIYCKVKGCGAYNVEECYCDTHFSYLIDNLKKGVATMIFEDIEEWLKEELLMAEVDLDEYEKMKAKYLRK